MKYFIYFQITRTEFLKYYEDASYAVESDVLFKALMNHAMTFSKETFKVIPPNEFKMAVSTSLI